MLNRSAGFCSRPFTDVRGPCSNHGVSSDIFFAGSGKAFVCFTASMIREVQRILFSLLLCFE
jgi:hypothetical protein